MPTSTELYGPTANVMALSLNNLHSSNVIGSSPVSPSTKLLSVQTTQPATSSDGHQQQLTSPLSPSETILTSTLSLSPSEYSVTRSKVNMDALTALLLDTCTNLQQLYTEQKIGKEIDLISQLGYIKDEYLARLSELINVANNPAGGSDGRFVGKSVWMFERSVLKFNSLLFKLRSQKLWNMLSGSSKLRSKVEKGFGNVMTAWQELMVNLSLAMNGHSQHETSAAGKPTGGPSNAAMAECLVGDKYLFGYGVTKSYDQAFKHYQIAARNGSAEAMNMLGSMYENGLGISQSVPMAIEQYRLAANMDFAESHNNIGRLMEKAKKFKEASEHYLKAAQLGSPDAMVSLGFLIENRICGVVAVNGSETQDVSQHNYLQVAREWYELAAGPKYDYARAQNCVGSLLYKHSTGPSDDVMAVKYLKQAADQGNAHALNNLGICYEEGRGVTRDLSQSKEYYGKSAEMHHASGTNNLGYIYLLEKSYQDAFRWFNVASALGSVDSLYNIGAMWESGVLHPDGQRDLSMALYYYNLAASKGSEKAKQKLGSQA